MSGVIPKELFFTFLDRSLAYDCPSCGSLCCKGAGLALGAQGELLRFTRLEPRLSLLVKPASEHHAEPVETGDGCWMLEPDGRCAIELLHGRSQKPVTCRLFPFNRIFRAGPDRVVDFNSRICPLQDAADARTGQGWEELAEEIGREGEAALLSNSAALPRGAAELGWRLHEERLRDAIADHLDEADYASFAALQEETLQALAGGRPLPRPHDPPVLERAERLRALLGRWRGLLGVDEDAGLPRAARAAARQVALLTTSWRVNLLLRPGAGAYPWELQLLPKQLLAASHLVELGHLARRRAPGLRTATEVFQGAQPLAALLTLVGRRVRLEAPLSLAGTPPELHPRLRALSSALLDPGARTLDEILTQALDGAEVHLRGLALAALASSAPQLRVEA